MQQDLRFNPYEIMNVPFDISFYDLKQQFKKLARIHHPDKGGNPHNFMLLKESFKLISLKMKKEFEMKKRTDSEEYMKTYETGVKETFNAEHKQKVLKMQEMMKRDPKLFNRQFENSKIKKPSDFGYKDADFIQKEINERREKKKGSLQMEKFSVPEPVNNDKHDYFEFKNFDESHSNDKVNSKFCDMVGAYCQDSYDDLVNRVDVKEFSSVEEFKKHYETKDTPKVTKEKEIYLRTIQKKKDERNAMKNIRKIQYEENTRRSDANFFNFLEYNKH